MYKLLKATFITVWSVFVLFPIMWAITTSFKPEAAVVNGATFIPWLEFQPVLTGWKAILPGPESLTNLLTPTLNSFIITAGSTAISLIFGSLAAYGLSRFTYGWKRYSNADIIFFFVSQRIMPPVVLAIPFFLVLKQLRLLDTHLGLILVLTSGLMPVVVWLMVDFFNALPREIDEMAMLEGCNPIQAFFRTILPLSKPGLTVAGMFCVIFGWNDIFFALTLTATKVLRRLRLVVSAESTLPASFSLHCSMTRRQALSKLSALVRFLCSCSSCSSSSSPRARLSSSSS